MAPGFGPWWKGSATIFPGRLRALGADSSWRDGKLQPITFSTEQIIVCSLHLFLAVAEAYQMVVEEVRIDSMMAE